VNARNRSPIVLLHGLTFDRRMWRPVLRALPGDRGALALDLPGHGAAPRLGRPGLSPVVESVHDAVRAAGLCSPVLVGHSIGGPIAAIYASRYPTSGVVSVDAPIRLESFAGWLQSIRAQLEGPGFDELWSAVRRSWRLDLVPAAYRDLLRGGTGAPRELFIAYQADLLQRPLEHAIRWRDNGLAVLRERCTPYLSLHASRVEPDDRGFLRRLLPQAEIVEWPVGHHFPHLADPEGFATLLGRFA
jgi:pimeloyl-ACP methyl ester carboxylesterase